MSGILSIRDQNSICSQHICVNDFERCLATPTAQIIERHDFRTILDFLLMKLRTALNKDWLQSVPILHKVFRPPYLYSDCNWGKICSCIFILFQCVLRLEYSLADASAIIEVLSNNWDQVRDQLNQVARLPAYCFHIREVIISTHVILRS